MTGKYSDEDLAELTAEERAGLLEREAEENPAATVGDAEDLAKAEGTGAKAEAGAVEGKVVADPGSEPKAAEADKGEKPVAIEGEAEKTEQPRDDAGRFTRAESTPVPLMATPDVTAAKAALDGLKATRDELLKKFEDGDLSAREYSDQLAQATEQAAQARALMLKAEIAAELQQNQQKAVDQTWYDNAAAFMRDHPETSASVLKYNAFDTALRLVNGDPKTNRLPQEQQLNLALKAWRAEFGIAEPAAAAVTDPKAGKGALPGPSANGATGQVREIPKTLAKVPAADMTEQGGEFASLDALEPEAYMAKLEKMSDAERARYMAS